MGISLGQLPSAPLAYVLAEVRFAAIVDLAKRATETHDVIRERFPRAEAITGFSFSANIQPAGGFGVPGAIQFYTFTNLARTAAVMLSSSGLSYSVTEYQTYQAFQDELAWLFSSLKQVLEKDLVERCGLRYIDVIVPRNGESLFDYVAAPIGAITNPEHPRVQMVVEFPRSDGALALRLISLNAPLYLSPDILQINLIPPDWIQAAQSAGLPTGILDMDRWSSAAQTFGEQMLLETYAMMREDLRTMFDRVVTPHAMGVWRQSRSSS